MTNFGDSRQEPQPRTEEVFDPYRRIVATLAMALLRLEESSNGSENKASSDEIKGASAQFHSNFSSFNNNQAEMRAEFKKGATFNGLGAMVTDGHYSLCSQDFVQVALVAQIFYHLGEYEEAMKFAGVFGAPAVPLRSYVRINDEKSFQEAVARELNDWYLGYFIKSIKDASISNALGAQSLCRLGMPNPTLQLIDDILLGDPDHAAFSSRMDECQRAHLAEWRRKVAPNYLSGEISEMLRNDPWGVFDLLQKRMGL